MSGFPSVAKGNKKGEVCKRPLPGIPLALCRDKILELIPRLRGNLSRIADALGTTRNTVRNRCDRDPELKQALLDARERMIDQLETCVWDRAVESNDTSLQIFILKTQARHRGWDQSEAQHTAKDIATAAFDFILNKSKNPAERVNATERVTTLEHAAHVKRIS